MDQQAFAQQLRADGYADAQAKEFAPDLDGPLHAHDFSARLLILDGEFTLAREDAAHTYRAGDVCEVPAGTRHAERTGPAGAKVLVGRK